MTHNQPRLGQLAITVSDVEQALIFYRDTIGLAFLFAPTQELAFLQCGDTRIMLTTPQGAGEAGKNSVPYFSVTDIESFYTDAIDKGATAERPPELAVKMPDHDLWLGFLRDPAGNLIGLMEEKH